ncbi:hypothetical protein FB645_000052 [Coemansia sp. IMI 203386]|nr:hypothetical protein FB645_000052 [Coemansia sp. IMI 203386]
MSKEEKPRGLRARLRQRRARNSSEEEIKSRPTSLDLGRSNPPHLGTTGHSLTTVPTRASGYHNQLLHPDGTASDDDADGGLALGEFTEDGEEVVDDTDADVATGRPSGAILRSQSQDFRHQQQRGLLPGGVSRRSSMASRRISTHSVPGYSVRSDNDSAAYSVDQSYDETGGDDDNEAENIPEEDEEEDEGNSEVTGEFDVDGELNAVYLKRNADFHMLFRNIPINELLIEDYGCALQRDILVQGRLYLTENFVCFYSNIFGWVTSLVIAFDEIMTIDKKMTALIIPNAIQVSTLHAKHFFGSFMYRDSAYNQLYDLWAKSRSERHAGMPEIGRAEGGEGAGDVSRHRENVLNAYQSLSEDEEGSVEERGNDGESDSGSASDTESGSSDQEDNGGVEVRSGGSDVVDGELSDGKANANGGGQNRQAASSVTNLIAGAKDAMAAAAATLSSTQQQQQPVPVRSPGSESAVEAGDNDALAHTPALSANGASSIIPLTATDSVVSIESASYPARAINGSAMTTKVQGTENGGTPVSGRSTTSLAANANGPAGEKVSPSRALLARLPKTPDGTDAAQSKASSVHSKQGVKPNEATDVLHRPTACPCGSDGRTAHYSHEALDAVFPLSLPLLFRVVFSASVPSDVERRYMPVDKVGRDELAQSCTKRISACGNSDVKTEGWVPDPEDAGREMCIYTYEKPLGFSIGPKSTAVEDTFRIVTRDFGRAVVVEQVVRTPNVPSGTAFFVKIRHCLTWTAGPSNQPPGGWSRYQMTFDVEWTKSSWIKNAIEKGSADSNKQAGELLEKYIREWIAAHPTMEVKARQAHGIVPKGSVAVKTRRNKGNNARNKNRRDESPRGLRMEELIGNDSQRTQTRGSERSRRGSGVEATTSVVNGAHVPVISADHIKDTQATVGGGGAGNSAVAKEADVWRRRAADSWIGWLGCHTVYPATRMSRKAGQSATKLLSSPVAGPLVVFVLLLVLVLTNTWRFTGVSRGSANMRPLLTNAESKADGMGVLARLGSVFSFSSSVHVEGIDEMRRSVDSLTAQMAVINQQLQRLIDQQQQNL